MKSFFMIMFLLGVGLCFSVVAEAQVTTVDDNTVVTDTVVAPLGSGEVVPSRKSDVVFTSDLQVLQVEGSANTSTKGKNKRKGEQPVFTSPDLQVVQHGDGVNRNKRNTKKNTVITSPEIQNK